MPCPTCGPLRWKLPSRRWPSTSPGWCCDDGADETAAQSFEDFVKRYEQQAWRLIECCSNDTPQQCA